MFYRNLRFSEIRYSEEILCGFDAFSSGSLINRTYYGGYVLWRVVIERSDL